MGFGTRPFWELCIRTALVPGNFGRPPCLAWWEDANLALKACRCSAFKTWTRWYVESLEESNLLQRQRFPISAVQELEREEFTPVLSLGASKTATDHLWLHRITRRG